MDADSVALHRYRVTLALDASQGLYAVRFDGSA